MLLKLTGINKEFKIDKNEKFKALNDVSLEFDKGEFVAILGPSGCGKSTLLNIIAGLDKPSSGELVINQQSTKNFRDKDWDFYRKNSIGFVFQQFNLIEHLSALENVEIVMSLTGVSKATRRKRACELLEQVGLNQKQALHLPSELSGGQKQRVAIARALANDPDIILADEPTGALDVKTGLQVMNLLKSIAKDKLIIMVTHNQQLAKDYSTRIIRILDGQIQAEEVLGAKHEVSKHESFKKKNKAMPFKEALKLSFRNMKKKLGRVTITAIAGSIGIAGISLIMGLSNGANIFIDDQVIKFGSSNVIEVSKAEKNKKGEIVDITDPKRFDYLKDNKEVALIRPALEKQGNWEYKNDTVETEMSSLANKPNQQFLKEFLIGELPQKNEVIINKALARDLLEMDNEKIENINYNKALNKKITLDLASTGLSDKQEFTVSGIIDEIDVNESYIYYNYDDLKSFYQSVKIFATNLYKSLTKKVSTYEVVIKDSKKLNEVKQWIIKHDDVKTERYGSGMLSFGSEGVKVSSFALIFQESLSTIISLAKVVMIAFLVIALIVSSILIAIVLFSSVLERRTEIGILKAVGARRKDIMRVFQSEAILLGLLSGVIGIVASFILVPVAEIIFNQFSGVDVSGIVKIPLSAKLFNVSVPLLLQIGLILISIIVAFIAGYIPSRKATKMEVIDALRDE